MVEFVWGFQTRDFERDSFYDSPMHRNAMAQRSLYAIVVSVLVLAGLSPFWIVHYAPSSQYHLQQQQRTTERSVHHQRQPPSSVRQDTAASTSSTQTTVAAKSQQPPIHIVFSTSCSDQQNWESYVFFYHAFRVRQPGTVTRIASGCKEQEAKTLQDFHDTAIRSMNTNFRLHLTPDFSRIALDHGAPYKYNNKPFGMQHFLNAHPDSIPDDHIVALMDPDMILLQPMLADYTDANNMDWVKAPRHTKVSTGHPISQQDGYLNNEWISFNRSIMFANFSHEPEIPTRQQAEDWYNAGPPYLASIKDWKKLASSWTRLAQPVLSIFPKLFAEMYSFVWATVYEESPWQMTKSLTVSTTESGTREGWKFIDALPIREVCDIGQDAVTNGTDYVLPVSLHYCKRYSLKRYFFSKYRIKKNIMRCDKNLLEVPNDIYSILQVQGDSFTAEYPPQTNGDPSKSPPRRMRRRTAAREAFMLCALTRAVNNALAYYKQQFCESPNLNETYSIFTDFTNH